MCTAATTGPTRSGTTARPAKGRRSGTAAPPGAAVSFQGRGSAEARRPLSAARGRWIASMASATCSHHWRAPSWPW